jgi:hypothetical protein
MTESDAAAAYVEKVVTSDNGFGRNWVARDHFL